MAITLKQHAVATATLVSIVSVLVASSDPQHVPPLMLIAACLLVTATLWSAVSLLVLLMKRGGLIRHTHWKISLGLSAAIGALLALQSVGQLSAGDLYLSGPLAVIGYFYVSYGKMKPALQSSP